MSRKTVKITAKVEGDAILRATIEGNVFDDDESNNWYYPVPFKDGEASLKMDEGEYYLEIKFNGKVGSTAKVTVTGDGSSEDFTLTERRLTAGFKFIV